MKPFTSRVIYDWWMEEIYCLHKYSCCCWKNRRVLFW